MDTHQPSFNELFEPPILFPDPEMKERLSRLVGLDEYKERLSKLIGLLVNPAGLKEWAGKYHPGAKQLLDFTLRRPPLVILAGDVGSGKSEIAYTIGDQVARQEQIDVTLFPLSLATRGIGRVGQMTQLISAAFSHTIEKAKNLKSEKGKSRGAIILLIDEADALAQSRENAQMHHEDKAGVNAFIRGIDALGHRKLPAAVIMCTNRLGALDPAIRRRAAEILPFQRPGAEERLKVLGPALLELGLTPEMIEEIVEATGPKNGLDYGFTFSDLVQRLLPSIVLEAYPNHKVNPESALRMAQQLLPTSPFNEN